MPEGHNKLSRFWQELKRRKVTRVITVYAAAAFVILELIDIIAEPFGLPDWTMKLVVVLLIIGLIVSIIVSWIYDIHPEGGIVKTEPAQVVSEDSQVQAPASSKAWKIASYISFLVIVGLIVLNIIPRANNQREIHDKSIAILPFINNSEDKGNEHIINGIMEEILINLQSIKDLRVPGRTSVEQYRTNPKPIPEIASELNVAYIVEGSGQKYGNKIRLRVLLREGATDKQIWADSYDEEIKGAEDIFRIQSLIAESIAEELKAIITPEEKELIENIPTFSLTAHDFYQRAKEEHPEYWSVQFESDHRGLEELERAEDYYNKALKNDSTYAQAYVGLAQVYFIKESRKNIFSQDFMDTVLTLTNIALSFDDQLAVAYTIRGDYYRAKGLGELATKEYNKAIKLNPNDWIAYDGKGDLYFNIDLVKQIENYRKAALLNRGSALPGLLRKIGWGYSSAGFREKSKYFIQEALELDDDTAEFYRYQAIHESQIGNFEEAIEIGEKGYAIDSTNKDILRSLASYYMYLGQFEAALVHYKKYFEWAVALENPAFNVMHRIGYAYWKNEYIEEADYYFNEQIKHCNKMIELGRHYTLSKLSYYDLAAVYAFREEKDKAYENLEIFIQREMFPNWMVALIKSDPLFDSIRDEPEFQQILREVEAKYQAEHERVRQWLEENDML